MISYLLVITVPSVGKEREEMGEREEREERGTCR